MKRIVRLTETQFKSLVAKNVKKIINEQLNVRDSYDDDEENSLPDNYYSGGNLDDEGENEDEKNYINFNDDYDDGDSTLIDYLSTNQRHYIDKSLDKTFNFGKTPITFKLENKIEVHGVIDTSSVDEKIISFYIDIPKNKNYKKFCDGVINFKITHSGVTPEYFDSSGLFKKIYKNTDNNILKISDIKLHGDHYGKTLDGYIKWILKKVNHL